MKITELKKQQVAEGSEREMDLDWHYKNIMQTKGLSDKAKKQTTDIYNKLKKKKQQGVAEGMAGIDDAEPYTIGGAVDKQYVYTVMRDGKSMGIYHSLDDAKLIVANNKRINKYSKFKIQRKPRSKMAGPVGQLPEQGVAEGSGQEPGDFEIYDLRTMQRVYHPFEADDIMDAFVKADDWLEAIGKSGRGLSVRPVREQGVAEGRDNPLQDIDPRGWHLIQGDRPIAINFPDEYTAKSFHSGHGYGRETKILHGSQVRQNAYLKHNPGVINYPEYSKGVAEGAGNIGVGSKVYHPIHGSGKVLKHSTGPGADHWADVKFVSGETKRVNRKHLKSEQGVAEGEYKSRHIHRQEQNKKYDEYCRSQEAAGKKPMSRGDWAATQRKGQKQGVAEGELQAVVDAQQGGMPLADVKEARESCPECGGPMFPALILGEKQDACYYKVKSRYKVWPSAYASGALVQCRKKGAANWGNKGK